MPSSLHIRRACLAAVATLVTGGIAAGAIVSTAAEPQARLALDVPGPLFAARSTANLLPGQSRTACTTIRNAGDAPGRAALYARGVAGRLAPYLTLTVTRGARAVAEAGSRSCGTFVAEARGVVFQGRLSDFPRSLPDAVLEPGQWAPGDRHAYRFTLRLLDDPAAAGLSAHWDLRAAIDSLPVARPRHATATSTARCTSVQVAGTGVGRLRALTRSVRIDRRVGAVLMVRSPGAAAGPALAVTTGLRVRGHKTLLIPRWARVRYRLNGRLNVAAGTRPFRAQLRATDFAPGHSRISVAVQRATRSAKRLAAFELTVTPTRIAGRDVCVVSA